MCDSIKLFGMLSRIDERTALMKEDQDNIFGRLRELELKSPICPEHAALVKDVSRLQTDVKVAGVKIVIITSGITTVTVLFLTWVASNITF